MEQSVAAFAVVNFAVIGLSHLLQPLAWREFFIMLSAQGRPGAFANGLLTLTMASVIVSFHNVWSGVPLLLTVLGWCYVLKSLTVLVVPQWGLRSMQRAEHSAVIKFRVAGVLLLAIAAVIGWCLAAGLYEPGINAAS